ncbi:hypothetical protein HK098_004837 [Nowakowskiella sp. JEL0407]|nr:hypothetical protein HK098_004837 [Nowakowskiella sp. JEL0407]
MGIKSIVFASALLASTVAAQCGSLNAQCGGKVFSGSTCCNSGLTCKFVSDWYSQCITDTNSNCLPANSQCGGQYYTGLTCCQSGSTCKYVNQWYSQCQAGTQSPSPSIIMTSPPTSPRVSTSPSPSPSPSPVRTSPSPSPASSPAVTNISGTVNPTRSSGHVPFPVDICTNSGCQTLNTELVEDKYKWNVNSGEFYQFGSKGLLMNKPLSRVYVSNPQATGHQMFYLKNRQISVDVNVAGVACGYNAAFYFSEMETNVQPGSGYCDAQAATSTKPACNEMDVLETNIGSNAVTIHSCDKLGGQGTACDPWGCGDNTFTNNLMSQVGPGAYIDTLKTYTIVTAFATNDGTDNGVLSSVTQTYKQDGKSYSLPQMNQNVCQSGKYWASTGALPGMSKALDKGMTMIMSYWGGANTDMTWLDGGSGKNQACSRNTGTGQAFFMNVRVEPIH